MKKNLIALVLFILVSFFFQINTAYGQKENATSSADYSIQKITPQEEVAPSEDEVQPLALEESFEARVINILDTKKIEKDDGSILEQQNLLLRGIEGKWKDKEFKFEGISEIEVSNAGIYKIGDQVLVSEAINQDGSKKYFVTDFVRRGYLYLLALIFCVIIIIIGKTKGIKSLLGLAISFLIIVKFILPKILDGSNPLYIGLVGAFFMLTIMIYLSEGWNRKSHLSILSVLFSLLITLILSLLFTNLTRLSGLSEDATFLIGLSKNAIDFRGLLLAGMMVGVIGVLDDVIVSQIEAVNQIKEANPKMDNKSVFKAAFKIGNTHLGTMVNTLFLTYAGTSLPLLLLFIVNQGTAVSFSQVINNELIATEIVRTLVGSIGVAASMPIATYLGVHWLKIKK